MTTLSRRQFFGGALLGAAGLATSSALVGCGGSPKTSKSAASTADAKPDAPASWTQLNPQESYGANSTDFSALFSEIKVGTMTLRNRLCKSAAGSDTAVKKSTTISQNSLDYYGRFADGGTALIVLEDGLLAGFGMNPFRKMVVDSVEAGIAEAKRVADRVHEGGAYVGPQLGLGTPTDPGDCNAYTVDELKKMITDVAEAALRVKQAGFDFIEIKGATNDGLNQFVSRHMNHRTDEYGAETEENRVRFFTEIIAGIRAACGEDFNILVLINGAEENDVELGNNDTFITIDESKALAKSLVAAGANLVQVRVGTNGQEANCWATDVQHAPTGAHGATGYGTQFDFSSHFSGVLDGSHEGLGAFIPMAREIKSVVDVPVGCASYMDPRIAPDLINNAVANGDVDLVFMNRPLTVQPDMANLLKEGRIDEVRPCTRCFHCHGKPYGEDETCRVNPTTQFAYTKEFPEGYDLTKAENPLNVLVVGAGPAGMEAAITAAERGHKVTLCDSSSSTGGMLRFADAVKGPREHLGTLCDYFAKQLELKGVTVKTGETVTADSAKAENPDAVIVAVGGKRESRYSGTVSMDGFASAEIGSNVIVLGANLQAIDVAQKLLAEGKKVTLITEGGADTVDAEQSYWVRKYTKANLFAHGVKVWCDCTIDDADESSVTFKTATGIQKTLSADTVVECFDMQPNTELLDELKAAGINAIAAGCDAPSNIQTAIHAGYKVARYL